MRIGRMIRMMMMRMVTKKQNERYQGGYGEDLSHYGDYSQQGLRCSDIWEPRQPPCSCSGCSRMIRMTDRE